MATIASLAVKLLADPTQLVVGFDKASKKIAGFAQQSAKFGGKLNAIGGNLASSLASGDPLSALRTGISATTGVLQNVLGRIPKIGILLSAAAGVAGGALEGLVSWLERVHSWFREGAARIGDMRVAALKLGVDVGAVAGLSLMMGGDVEMVSKGMVKFGNAIQLAASKAEGTETTFASLGLNAKELAGLPLDQALAQYAEKFNQLDSAGKKSVAAMEIFGERFSSNMLPLLAKGAAGFKAASATADRFALSVTSVDAESIRQASLSLKQAQMAAAGVKTQIAVGLSPVINQLAAEFGGVSVSAKLVQSWAMTGAKVIAYGGAIAVEAWKGLQIVWDMLKVGFKTMAAGWMRDIVNVLTLLGKLPDSMGGGVFRVLAEDAQRETARMMESINEDVDAGKAHIADFGSSFSKVDEFFARAADRAKAMEQAMGKPKGAMIDPELVKKGIDLTNQMKNPLEKFYDKMGEINQLIDAGVISWETYSRAVAGAAGEIMNAHKAADFKAAGAAEFGSQDAFKTITNSVMGSNSADPVKRLEDAIKAEKELLRRSAQANEEVARYARRGFVGRVDL